ncbi:hypothetical protein FRC01_003653 [Tulasnella sp. 417]|nr:hypothetical protein FRC01_003653 [Tulasnella sp. 417]
MRFTASVALVAALLAQTALATDCQAGTYKKYTSMNRYTCEPCGAGEYTDGPNKLMCSECSAGKTNNAAHTTCQQCPAGSWSSKGSSCQACPAGSGLNAAQTSCTPCTGGQWSTAGGSCQNCPAGQQGNNNKTGCDKCSPGWYNGTGGSTCKKCPKGEFNNVFGATHCCDCCAGWYSNSEGSTLCKKCSDVDRNKPNSRVGAESSSDCKRNIGGDVKAATGSCSMVADNVCPNTTGGGPQGTAITRKRRDVQCANGLTACTRYAGRGGFDCVDTENDPESCGGCVGLDGEGDGTDCTAIKGVSVTRCVKRSCVIDSCRKGWVKSIDGSSCVLASHGTGSPEHLHAQDSDAKKIKRSSAKRAIRHTIF